MLDAQDIALATTTAAYAAILDGIKDRLEPDWTWAEVTVGTTMCLAAAAIRVRITTEERAWSVYERATWRAFAVGGTPIIAWQVGRAIWRHLQARERERREAHERAKALAKEPTVRPRRDESAR